MAVTRVPVSQVTGLHTTSVAATVVALAWTAPKRGTPPIAYTVFYRKHGAAQWIVGPTSKVTNASVAMLHPSTQYEIEILAHNQ